MEAEDTPVAVEIVAAVEKEENYGSANYTCCYSIRFSYKIDQNKRKEHYTQDQIDDDELFDPLD